jgi:hypothetical protein
MLVGSIFDIVYPKAKGSSLRGGRARTFAHPL